MALLLDNEKQAITSLLGYAYDGAPQDVIDRLSAELSDVYLNRVREIVASVYTNDKLLTESVASSSVVETCKVKLSFPTTIRLLHLQRAELLLELTRLLGIPSASSVSGRRCVPYFTQYQ